MIVFLSGGTGYLGRRLVARILKSGHQARVLTRRPGDGRVPESAAPVQGNVLDAHTFTQAVAGCDSYVHLTGTPHPAPWKEREFRAIDLVSLQASAEAAAENGVRHFVYVSVAQPAPVMQAYIRVRRECEEILKTTGIPATILRPWYVLGPGHRWPWVLQPAYALAERIPATRESALRLGLVTLEEMAATLVWAVENPADGTRILTVADIRRIGSFRVARP